MPRCRWGGATAWQDDLRCVPLTGHHRPAAGNARFVTTLAKHTSRVRRAAAVGALLAIPFAPLTACGNEEGGNGGQTENEQNEETDDKGDEGNGY